MPPLETLIPFFVATAIFACVPGPGMLFAAAQTIARGRRVGYLSGAGFHLGGYVHIAAAAFGLAVLLETVPSLYAAVKLAGVAYLIWMGIGLLAGGGPARPVAAVELTPDRRAIRDGIAVEVLNPKTALFFLAFLPQFTDASASLPIWAQVLILGATVNVIFSATDLACVLLSDKVSGLLSASRWANLAARWIGGAILVGLGIRLATTRP